MQKVWCFLQSRTGTDLSRACAFIKILLRVLAFLGHTVCELRLFEHLPDIESEKAIGPHFLSYLFFLSFCSFIKLNLNRDVIQYHCLRWEKI